MNDVVVIGAGQSGLAAARAVRDRGLTPVVLEAGPEPVGSWPSYYDSLTVFSPVEFSSMPGLTFPGHPEHYPHRDEVVDYLRAYAERLDVDIRTRTRVTSVESVDDGFVVRTAAGDSFPAAGVVAATGSFGNPYLPSIPGQNGFAGRLLHVADYRDPQPHAGERVVVVGAGNSAIQVGDELADVADVTLATRHPIRFLPQCRQGRDVHYWLTSSGFDDLPPQWLARLVSTPLVSETGGYHLALESGRMEQRRMLTRFDGERVVWADGRSERVDSVIFATGYRPDLAYLEPLGALDEGAPRMRAASRSPTRGWSTSAWSCSVRSRPTPCAGCIGTPSTSPAHSRPTSAGPRRRSVSDGIAAGPVRPIT